MAESTASGSSHSHSMNPGVLPAPINGARHICSAPAKQISATQHHAHEGSRPKRTILARLPGQEREKRLRVRPPCLYWIKPSIRLQQVHLSHMDWTVRRSPLARKVAAPLIA